MPIMTMLYSLTGGSSRRNLRACSTISPAERLRPRPMRPVAQKRHAKPHPCCEERQNVVRDGVDM
jgi:hypothetical protein